MKLVLFFCAQKALFFSPRLVWSRGSFFVCTSPSSAYMQCSSLPFAMPWCRHCVCAHGSPVLLMMRELRANLDEALSC
jgi:hypothetical protein